MWYLAYKSNSFFHSYLRFSSNRRTSKMLKICLSFSETEYPQYFHHSPCKLLTIKLLITITLMKGLFCFEKEFPWFLFLNVEFVLCLDFVDEHKCYSC